MTGNGNDFALSMVAFSLKCVEKATRMATSSEVRQAEAQGGY